VCSKDEEGWLHLPRVIFIAIIFLLPASAIQSSEAQGRLSFKGRSALKTDGGTAFWQSSDLTLTTDQKKRLESFRRAFSSEALPLRRGLMSLRFELRHLMRDQNVQSKALFDLQKKISEIQVKLDNLFLSYQIKVRSILTKEQLEQFPQNCSLGIGPEYDIPIGIGGGPRRGSR